MPVIVPSLVILLLVLIIISEGGPSAKSPVVHEIVSVSGAFDNVGGFNEGDAVVGRI